MEDVVKLVVNGVEFTNFISFELKNTMISITTDFSFTYAPKIKYVNKKPVLVDVIKEQDEVKIFINNIQYLIGYIVSIDWNEDAGNDLITVQGMDKASYCLLRHYPSPKNYKKMDYAELIRTVVAENGFQDIVIVQKLIPELLTIEGQEDIQIDDGETLFNFLDRYALKAQVLLNTTGTGELVIYREGVLGSVLGKFPNKAKAGIALINGGRAANILSSNFKTSVLERFQVIEIFSQSNNTSHSVKNTNPIGSAVDEQIKIPNRFRVGKNIPTQSTTLADIAKWNVNVRRAKGRMYNCTVQGIGFSPQNRDFWKINTYVEVLDEKKGVNGEFLIESITFSQSPQNGTITQLQLVNKGSYTLDIKQAIQKLQRNNFGNQFSS